MRCFLFKGIAFSLAIMMLATTFFSCSDSSDEDSQSILNEGDYSIVNTDENVESFDPELPEADFEGYTFTFAGRGENGTLTTHDAIDLVVDGLNSEIVNDAIYRRNLEICQKYNFKLQMDYVGAIAGNIEGGAMTRAIETIIMSDDNEYDAIVSATSDTIGFSMNGWLVDLYGVEHLNFTKKWWDQSVARDLNIGKKLYMATGDIMTSDKKGVLCVTFNKKLSAELHLPDHYKLVKKGEWTLETFYENALLASEDRDGDGWVSSKDDRYGYVYWQDAMYSFITGTGNAIGRVVNGDTFELTANNESMINVWEDMVDFLNTNGAFSVFENRALFGGNYGEATRHMLENNNALYVYNTADGMIGMRSYDANLGMLPNPKLDESQKEYISAISPWCVNFVSIPITNDNLSRTGHILEALAAKGRELVRPAYYETTLATRAASDYESAEMLDIMFDTRAYDIGSCLAWGNIPQALFDIFNIKNKNIVSTIRSKESNAKKDIEAQMILFGLY